MENQEIEDAITGSLQYLSSDEAVASIQRDPYWPKWDSPWWHMQVLHEIGLARRIPQKAVDVMVEKLKFHYLPVFPIREDEIPEGKDPRLHIACHCAVGSMYQILFACGVRMETELPWMRKWFLKYRLPDGGLNCDERVYSNQVPKSSIVSTLPCLEAVLFSRESDLTREEIRFLNDGAKYLLEHGLFRRRSTGEVIDKDWLEVRFPRLYDYDVLRGYYSLAKWREASGFQIPDFISDEVADLVSRQMTTKGLKLKRFNHVDGYNYVPQGKSWGKGEISHFPLFRALTGDGRISPTLTKMWYSVRPKNQNSHKDPRT